jgi:hypothetical protein
MPLHNAAAGGVIKVAELLLQAGASIDPRNSVCIDGRITHSHTLALAHPTLLSSRLDSTLSTVDCSNTTVRCSQLLTSIALLLI